MKKMLFGVALTVALTFSIGHVDVLAAENVDNDQTVSVETTVDNDEGALAWNYDSATKTLTITSGKMDEWEQDDYPWYGNIKSIRNIVIGDDVENIGRWAFNNMTLDSVKIGKGVEEIGVNAFYQSTIRNLEFAEDCNLKIDSGAFYEVKTLKEVIIPAGEYIGSSAFEGCNALSKVLIKDGMETIGVEAFINCKALKEVTIPGSVKTIERDAFKGDIALTKVDLSEGIETIGQAAFSSCIALANINVPSSVTTIESWAFYGNAALSTVTLNDGLSSIGDYAFCECKALREITIPDSVVEIGRYAFQDDNNLTTVKLSDNLTQLGYDAFKECKALKEIVIPENLTVIDSYTFYNCTSLTKVTLGEYVSEIDEHAFYSCSSLQEIVIPDSVSVIGSGAFQSAGLKSVTLGSGVNTIGSYAFAQTKLESLVIPGNVSEIRYSAFYDCNALTEVKIEEGITEIQYCAFQGCEALEKVNIPGTVSNLSSDLFRGCKNLKNVTLSEGILTAEGSIFNGCTSLEKIVLPQSLTIISREMFSNCTSLTSVTIGENVKTISENAFNNCDSLKSISIPESVNTIEGYAFYNCDALVEVDMSEGLLTIGSWAFGDCKKLKALVIPKSVLTINSNGITNKKINIVGYKGSKAEEYAKSYGHNFLSVDALYNVKFDGNGATGGSTNKMSNLNAKTIYKLTKNGFTKKGYKFVGWSLNKSATYGEDIYSDKEEIQAFASSDGATVTLFARWEAVEYSITYETNKGTLSSWGTKNSYFITTDTYTLPTPTRSGYIFEGWYTDKKFEGKPVTVIKKGSTGNKKFYAKWTSEKNKTYKITYNLNGGKNNSKNPSTFKASTKTVSLKSPEKTGYIFRGWYTDKNCTKKITSFSGSVKKDIVVYAKWEPIQYSITFYPNGGKGKAYTVDGIKYGKKYTLKANSFKKNGYTFVGWTTTKNGTGTVYKNKSQVKNLASKDGLTVKLYAQWKKK